MSREIWAVVQHEKQLTLAAPGEKRQSRGCTAEASTSAARRRTRASSAEAVDRVVVVQSFRPHAGSTVEHVETRHCRGSVPPVGFASAARAPLERDLGCRQPAAISVPWRDVTCERQQQSDVKSNLNPCSAIQLDANGQKKKELTKTMYPVARASACRRQPIGSQPAICDMQC